MEASQTLSALNGVSRDGRPVSSGALKNLR
jgi:hypothetical protein